MLRIYFYIILMDNLFFNTLLLCSCKPCVTRGDEALLLKLWHQSSWGSLLTARSPGHRIHGGSQSRNIWLWIVPSMATMQHHSWRFMMNGCPCPYMDFPGSCWYSPCWLRHTCPWGYSLSTATLILLKFRLCNYPQMNTVCPAVSQYHWGNRR